MLNVPLWGKWYTWADCECVLSQRLFTGKHHHPVAKDSFHPIKKEGKWSCSDWLPTYTCVISKWQCYYKITFSGTWDHAFNHAVELQSKKADSGAFWVYNADSDVLETTALVCVDGRLCATGGQRKLMSAQTKLEIDETHWCFPISWEPWDICSYESVPSTQPFDKKWDVA